MTTIPTATPVAATAPSARVAEERDWDDWDDLCVNPYQTHYDLGRTDGHDAGLRSGFEEGRVLGVHKATEVGIELGFYDGFAAAVLGDVLPAFEAAAADDEQQRTRAAKVRRGANELLRAVEAFPDADALFVRRNEGGKEALGGANGTSCGISTNALVDDGESSGPSSVDIASSVQRLRAKFKLLAVQLRIPQLSLKKVMEEAVRETPVVTMDSASSNDEEQYPSCERPLKSATGQPLNGKLGTTDW